MAKALDRDQLERVYHHVFLPSKLPHASDEATDIDSHLISLTVEALSAIPHLLPGDSVASLGKVITAIKNLKAVNSLERGGTSESELLRVLTSLTDGQSTPVLVRQQNAAVIVTRQQERLVFETFELSASNEAVTSAKGRLIRCFPGPAVALNVQAHHDSLKIIAETLSTMSHGVMHGMQPTIVKAGATHNEPRDTTNPGAVTELFVGFLRGFGESVSVSSISKNTRDEVLWSNTLSPWRRSPMWLLIKIVLHLLLSRSSNGSERLFKRVMLFIHSYIANLVTGLGSDVAFSSDCIYAMSAKIVRRLHKLRESEGSTPHRSDALLAHADGVVGRASCILSQQWRLLRKQGSRSLDLGALAKLDMEGDTYMSLPVLDEYIKSMENRPNTDVTRIAAPTAPLVQYDAKVLPSLLEEKYPDYHRTTANLQQFERWISRNIDPWLDSHEPTACLKLHNVLIQYHQLAKKHYANNPEGLSIMLLTVFELWVACDKAAVHECQLLRDYAPDVPLDALQSLLLPRVDQMGRLVMLESYMRDRSSRSREGLSNLLLSNTNANGFAARYFDASDTLKSLRVSIEESAEISREAKRAEFKTMQDEYERLDLLYEEEDCLYETAVIDAWCDPPETEERHVVRKCLKCSYLRQRDLLKIEVDEWPLPRDPVEASVVVFELKVPHWFSSWRDCKAYLLQDVLQGKSDERTPRFEYVLAKDPHLSTHYAAELPSPRRIRLLSENKPQVKTHYKMKGLAAMDVTDVCVANGANYRYHDRSTERFVGALKFDHDAIARSCTYTLPISALQDYIFRPARIPDGKSPNSSVSSQSSCPATMSLEEYKELTSIPLGHHIQWANMLLQLAMPSVDFRKEVTTLVFLQCAYQAGPFGGDVLRESHALFHSDAKTFDFVETLDSSVERVKRNWESTQALSLFASITTRVLSLNANAKTACFLLLAKIRDIAMTWIHSLRELALNAPTQGDRSLFVSKGVEVALVCASTYDVGDKHMTEMLSPAPDASILIQAAIVVQQGGGEQNWNDRYLGLLRLRFARLLHRCYKLLAGHDEALDNAIKCSWSAYIPCTTKWVTPPGQSDHCVTKETRGLEGITRPIRYNLLSGELLVNGLPVARAPVEYHTQPLWNTLFGTATIEVMPATSTGFRYSTKRSFQAHEVQLGMLENPAKLIVQASHCDAIIEIVPCGVLLKDLPEHFVQDHVHWYNFKSGNVEFRPANDPWNSSSPASWTLQKVRGMGWRLMRGKHAILGLQTPSAIAISKILKPLANARRIHCVLQTIDCSLRVEIPTLRLSFTLAKGDTMLASKEFRSMAVDGKQDLGTLVGFKNKLILKAKNGDRLLLLAEAPVVFTEQGGHVSVSAQSTDSISTVHSIRIDRLLGRLVDNGDLSCKFYTAYLHALTSFCLPDPFTCTTGTEQALNILGSSAVRSFDRLSQANVNILASIAGLCPGRSYYPADKRVMQSITWNTKLSFLSQHARLRSSAQAILDQAKQAAFYYPKNTLRFSNLQNVDDHLQKRDSIRSSTFRVPGYGAEEHTLHYDVEYDARDRKPSSRGERVALMSSFMARSGNELLWPVPTAGKMWTRLHAVGVVYGPEPDHKQYRYDGSLVMPKAFDNILAHLPLHHDKLAACQAPDERYSVTIWLATMAFAEGAEMGMLQVFAMFCKSPHLLQSRPPSTAKFDIAEGKMCTYDLLDKVFWRHVVPIASLEHTVARKPNEYSWAYKPRRRAILLAARRDEISQLIRALMDQWPCSDPTAPPKIDDFSHLKPGSAMKAAQAKFLSWYNNKLLQEYLDSIVSSLCSLGTVGVRPSSASEYESAPQPLSPVGYFSMEEIFATSIPKVIKTRPHLSLSGATLIDVKQSEEASQPRLEALLQILSVTTGESSYEKSYASDLRSSLEALRSQDQQQSVSKMLTTQRFADYHRQCEEYATMMYREILASIDGHPNSSAERTLQHWPRISPSLLLQLLAHDQKSKLPDAWKNRIVEYGVSLTNLQQAARLLQLQAASEAVGRNVQQSTFDGGSHAIDLLNELRNPGHLNWSPFEYPEYLLMEIESGIMIREVQQQIASEMRNPSGSKNAVMQLNMGEGKSTVVIPMVAAALADGSQLVRVVVAKPQSKQMAEMLISKFGGLLRRRIYYMPFSRSLQLTKPAAETMLEVLRQCRRTGGILLVQPEHVLSFRLMAPECFIAGKDSVGKTLMATQDFFDEHSRDIVDESDENFSVRFELIYTMGTQQPIEMSPDRWLLLQQVLDLVRKSAVRVAKALPLSIEIHPGGAGAFPRVRLLRADGMKLLMLEVAADVRDNGLRKFQMSRQSEKMREAIFDYITVLNPDEDTIQFVENGDFWESARTSILFLRGILAGGVLAFVLGHKRWRVNYGLASRSPPTKLAVPYRAKDSPSLRSEFSHPDVVITLTSLCYYYEGLNNEDMFTAFAHLMKSDRADDEYNIWLRHAPDVPQAFRQLQGVNLKDRPQCIYQVFPSLRHGKAVIDYFLSHIVFPKEIKQYPHKLSASGWDIGKKKSLVTTGFSGTNDSKRLLPLFVEQLDLKQQAHTNALVLEHLLQPVNSVEIMNPTTADEQISEAKRLLLTVLQFDPPVQVILDVGAQILELDNLNFAKTWLRLSEHGKEAAVFVNSFDELCVIDRKNRVDLLQTSPYFSRLDTCLVFLDESHTRGTDLKLPANYRAAVTLGAHLTKDRLVQACMRMRKLGQGQTVVFCIPQEIQSKIIETRPGDEKAKITVSDVLLWSISETHAETRRSMPLWTVQGERFVRQEKIWQSIVKDGVTSLSKAHAEKLLDEEAQSIDHRYRPRKAESQPAQFANSEDENLRLISKRCQEFDGLSFNASTLEEEQERELSPETEAEREAPKPQSAQPAVHALHKDILEFAVSGTILDASKAYMPAFESLKGTCASAELPLSQLSGRRKFMVTADFATTIQHSQRPRSAEMFQRHVQWVLTRSDRHSREVDLVLVISPYEANALYPGMTNPLIALHLYKPRCNAGYAALDQLDLFVSANTTPPALPRFLSVQLGLFAGQLYISSHADYLHICQFLGLSPRLVTAEMEQQGWKVGSDSFILSDGNGRLGGSSGLSKSPVNFFKVLLSKIRRNGDDISKTDMGGLLDGKPFHKSHWEEA